MKKTCILLSLLLLSFIIPKTYGQSDWNFSVIVGINKYTADYYGGFDSAKALIQNQFHEINHRFNAGNNFTNNIYFHPDSIYQFEGEDSKGEALKPHPGFDYRVAINGKPGTVSGGWFGPPNNSIHHSWEIGSHGGPFAENATDGLTHEFGHSRGAIDLYALEVDSAKNPVNGEAYEAVNSIMNYPFGNIIWDEHSVNLINKNANQVYTNSDYLTEAFPSTISIRVKNPQGQEIEGATVKLYPVNWFSNTVSAEAVYSGTTNNTGNYTPESNPFGPGENAPFHIQYPNFLVEATYQGKTNYSWMPLNEVQNHHFASQDYFNEIVLDVTPATKEYELIFLNQHDWGAGFTGYITIVNNSSEPINGWELVFDLPNAEIYTVWNCHHVVKGHPNTVTDAGWNAIIQPGQSREFGFNGNKSENLIYPVSGILNGVEVPFSISGSNSKKSSFSAEEKETAVFPNPAVNFVTVSTPNPGTVKFIDMNGNVVLEEKIHEEKISLNDLEAGIYLLQIESPEGIEMHKLTVNK